MGESTVVDAMSALRETHDRLDAAIKAGFSPRTIVYLIAECTLAMAKEQMARGNSVSGMAKEVHERLGKIAEEMERLNR
jgi:hypothetical protein